MPQSYPEFPDRQQMFDYLETYSRHFGLADRIEFKKTVTDVAPQPAHLSIRRGYWYLPAASRAGPCGPSTARCG
jgi:hypothetical protein